MSAPAITSQASQPTVLTYALLRNLRKLSMRYGPQTRLIDAIAAERARRAA